MPPFRPTVGICFGMDLIPLAWRPELNARWELINTRSRHRPPISITLEGLKAVVQTPYATRSPLLCSHGLLW